MPDSSAFSKGELQASVTALVGETPAGARYYGYETDPFDWDHGDWHTTSMGVELRLAGGAVFSATWGDAFGHFNIELRPEPVELQLRAPAPSWDVTTHERWSRFVGEPIVAAESIWRDNATEAGAAPIAVLLRFAIGTVWLVACETGDWLLDGEFTLAMDALTVVFANGVANRLGLAEPDPA